MTWPTRDNKRRMVNPLTDVFGPGSAPTPNSPASPYPKLTDARLRLLFAEQEVQALIGAGHMEGSSNRVMMAAQRRLREAKRRYFEAFEARMEETA